MPEKIKLIVVGDGNCGKTLMLSVFQKNKVLDMEFVPTVFETYIHSCQIDGVKVELELCDTAGQEGYDLLRLIAYQGANVVVLVYSISAPASLQNVVVWNKEVRSKLPSCPIVLVGNKTDLRNDHETREKLMTMNSRPVTEADGRRMKDTIGAAAFLECSAKYNDGVQKVFETAVRVTGVTIKQVVPTKTSFFSKCVLS